MTIIPPYGIECTKIPERPAEPDRHGEAGNRPSRASPAAAPLRHAGDPEAMSERQARDTDGTRDTESRDAAKRHGLEEEAIPAATARRSDGAAHP